MADGAQAPGCGEYNRKNALARQIYTIWRRRLAPNYYIWGCEDPLRFVRGRGEAKPCLRSSKTRPRSTAALFAGSKKPMRSPAQFRSLQIPTRLRARESR